MPPRRLSVTHGQNRTLFVTVGSTLFPALTTALLLPSTLSALSAHLTRLVVQHGKGSVVIPPGSTNVSMRADRTNFVYGGLEVEMFAYTSEFDDRIREADAVVSHAGSGSILATLRAGKPLLVVPNESLMDNHQAELADALGREGYLQVCSVADLQEGIVRLFEGAEQLQAFPPQDTGAFSSILDETAGFDR